jgi:hypothetical protein
MASADAAVVNWHGGGAGGVHQDSSAQVCSLIKAEISLMFNVWLHNGLWFRCIYVCTYRLVKMANCLLAQ